jgi:3-oxoacyl-[acyl-carrier-protein] synthase III
LGEILKSTITGWGKCIPDNVVTNDDMATFIDTSDEWIHIGPGNVTAGMVKKSISSKEIRIINSLESFSK